MPDRLGVKRSGPARARLRVPESGVASVQTNDDLGMAQPDDVAVGELPFLDRCVVDRGAVGRVQVLQHRDLSVPADLQMPTRDPGPLKRYCPD